MFLLILVTNLLGMFPFFGSATASLAVTFALALIAFLVIHISGIKENGFGGYLKTFIPHFHLEGGPVMKWFGLALTIGMAILEYLTAFIRFAVLAIRLFANMLAGHVALFMILFFITMVSRPHPTEPGDLLYLQLKLPEWLYYPVAIFSIVMVTALSLLEIFIAGLQAFIFCLLTSIFIGMAKHPPH
jgi:F-type H+-transporting ATPase subunit a